jgi:uncharacterized protein YqeY
VTLKERIDADLKVAMKAGDQLRKDTLRSVLSAFSYKKIEAGKELTEPEQFDVVRKLVKQRADAIGEYTKAGRAELAGKEQLERDILVSYLPPQMSADDIRAAVREKLSALPEADRNQGQAMKLVMPLLKDKAEGGAIRAAVLEELKALGGA